MNLEHPVFYNFCMVMMCDVCVQVFVSACCRRTFTCMLSDSLHQFRPGIFKDDLQCFISK